MLPLLVLACCVPAIDDPRPSSPADVLEMLQTAVADAIESAEPSVVAISRLKSEDGMTQAIRDPNRPISRGAPAVGGQADLADPNLLSFDFGSGVVIGDEGQILTAFHVVQGASKLYVRAPGGVKFYAEIVAADPRSDLAVLVPVAPAQAEYAGQFRPLPLGDATRLRKGAFLIALGNPYNAARADGRPSASWGILANVARQIASPPSDLAGNPVVRQFRHLPTLFQLDAKLNMGMSGGAVVDLRGRLVALTTAAADVQGFDAQAGYAIPLDALGRRIIETLKQGKEVEYGFLGIKLSNTPNSPPNEVGGVIPGTPADEAQLAVGDQILAVGDTAVEPVEGSLNLALSLAPVGSAVPLKLLRRGEAVETKIRLSKFPVEGEVIATNRPAPWRGLRVDFSSMAGRSTFDPEILKAMAKGGVLITEVRQPSTAEIAGLKPGQIITAVEGRPVRTPAEFRDLVKQLEGPVRIQTELGEVTVR